MFPAEGASQAGSGARGLGMKSPPKEKLEHSEVAALAKFFSALIFRRLFNGQRKKKKYILQIKNLETVTENSKQMWEENPWFIPVLPDFHMCFYSTITSRQRVF